MPGESPSHEEMERLRPLLALEESAIVGLAELAIGISTMSRIRRMTLGIFTVVGVIATAVTGVWAVWIAVMRGQHP